MKLYRCLAPLSLAVLLAACESLAPAPVGERGKGPSPTATAVPAKDLYTVKRGDTLYSIAQANGVDHRELAALNNIDNPSRIYVGQQLRLRPATAAAPSPESAAIRPRSMRASPLAGSRFSTRPSASLAPSIEPLA